MNEPPLGGHRHLPSWLLRSQVRTLAQCIGSIFANVSKKWREMRQICIEKFHNEQAPSRWSSPRTFMAATQPSLYTYAVYRIHICQFFSKSGMKLGRLALKSVTTNEPPLGGHRHLPSWLLRSLVCTHTQCIRPFSANVSKKWRKMRQIYIEKCHNEQAPSRWPSPITFMAAPQPSLYTYPVYKTHLCQCFQTMVQNKADLHCKVSQRSSTL